MAYTQFGHSLCMEVTLQDALKAQCSLLPRRKAVERLCITSYKMTVHVILSYPPAPWFVTVRMLKTCADYSGTILATRCSSFPSASDGNHRCTCLSLQLIVKCSGRQKGEEASHHRQLFAPRSLLCCFWHQHPLCKWLWYYLDCGS